MLNSKYQQHFTSSLYITITNNHYKHTVYQKQQKNYDEKLRLRSQRSTNTNARPASNNRLMFISNNF